jgi:hypothetical protein
MNFLLFILSGDILVFGFSGPDPKHLLTDRLNRHYISVADPDPGSDAFLTPGTGIRGWVKKNQDPDPG